MGFWYSLLKASLLRGQERFIKPASRGNDDYVQNESNDSKLKESCVLDNQTPRSHEWRHQKNN